MDPSEAFAVRLCFPECLRDDPVIDHNFFARWLELRYELLFYLFEIGNDFFLFKELVSQFVNFAFIHGDVSLQLLTVCLQFVPLALQLVNFGLERSYFVRLALVDARD